MQVGDIVEMEVWGTSYEQGECDQNHFICPVCNNQNDDIWGSADFDNSLTSDDVLECDYCHSEFKLKSDSWYEFLSESEIIKLGEI